MSETTTPKTSQKISTESARAQVLKLFEAFEVATSDDDGKEDPFVKQLTKAVLAGRLVIDGELDDVKIIQHLRGKIGEQKSVVWDWHRFGVGRARVKYGSDGVAAFGQAYIVAAPMIGFEVTEIQRMHPIDLSLVEDIAGFFQKV